jgi:hypothetical protein
MRTSVCTDSGMMLVRMTSVPGRRADCSDLCVDNFHASDVQQCGVNLILGDASEERFHNLQSAD